MACDFLADALLNCKLVSFKNNATQLDMDEWPVLVMADRCTTNKAARKSWMVI